jgi:hypothetical protein
VNLTLNNFLTQIKNLVTGGGRKGLIARHDAGYLRVAEGVSLANLATPSANAAATNTIIVPVGRWRWSSTARSTSRSSPTTSPSPPPASVRRGDHHVGEGRDVHGGRRRVGHDRRRDRPRGAFSNGSATNSTTITAANSGTAGAKLSFTVSSVTTFVEGTGHIEATVVNNDLANTLQGTADETNALVFKVPANVDTVGVISWVIPPDYDEATDEITVRVLASQLTSSVDNDVQLDAQVYKKVAGSALGSDLNPTIPSTILSTTEQWLEFVLTGNTFRRDNVLYFNLITDGHNDTAGEEVLIHAVEFKYRSTLVSYDEATSTGTPLR